MNCGMRIADCRFDKLKALSWPKGGLPGRRSQRLSLSFGRWALGVGRFLWQRIVLAIVIVLVIVSNGAAQSILLKTGQKIETLSVRRDGDMILGKVQVGTGSGEVGYHPGQIAKIEFPEPRGLKSATDLLGQGQPDKALAEIEPVVTYYEPFKDVAGGWWPQAALIKVSALAATRREAEAEKLATEIQGAVQDPEVARAAKLRVAAGLIRKKDFEKAMAICDETLKESLDSQTLANAWVIKGDALFGQRQWDTALMAYLHVPIFYGDEKSFMPAAMLGSARTYWRLDDTARAKKSFDDLIAAYPKSSEATIAQSEMQKMQR